MAKNGDDGGHILNAEKYSLLCYDTLNLRNDIVGNDYLDTAAYADAFLLHGSFAAKAGLHVGFAANVICI